MVRERDVQHGDSATMLNGNLRRAATVKRRFHFGDGFPDEVLTREHTKMHRLIMGLDSSSKLVVDHIRHNTLDNRKKYLRVCTQKENLRNRKK